MRYLRRVTKYNIILLAAIVFALVCPTVVTFVLVKNIFVQLCWRTENIV